MPCRDALALSLVARAAAWVMVRPSPSGPRGAA